MREIKFRQPHVDITGKFIDWFYWGFVNGGFIAPIRFDLPNYQYTGLKDKNGKEIYEGDILQGKYFTKRVKLYEVKEISIYGLVLKGQGEMSIRFYSDLPQRDTIEVIGNLYENPDLFEGRK